MSTRTLLTALFATALTMPILAQAADTPTTEQQPPGSVPSAAPVAPATPPVATLPATATPAATPSNEPATTTAGAAVTVGGSTPTAPAVTRDKDTLSVDFPDEDIKTILRNVADLFELNLVVPDTLAGKTSIKLRDVTWRQIFQPIADSRTDGF